jgi:hypothetical protein
MKMLENRAASEAMRITGKGYGQARAGGYAVDRRDDRLGNLGDVGTQGKDAGALKPLLLVLLGAALRVPGQPLRLAAHVRS